jgi:predicted ATPase
MPPLIGRERELALALTAFDAAVEGRGSIVLIDGEPGVGKTRLARERLSIARSRGARILVGPQFRAICRGSIPPIRRGIRRR